MVSLDSLYISYGNGRVRYCQHGWRIPERKDMSIPCPDCRLQRTYTKIGYYGHIGANEDLFAPPSEEEAKERKKIGKELGIYSPWPYFWFTCFANLIGWSLILLVLGTVFGVIYFSVMFIGHEFHDLFTFWNK